MNLILGLMCIACGVVIGWYARVAVESWLRDAYIDDTGELCRDV